MKYRIGSKDGYFLSGLSVSLASFVVYLGRRVDLGTQPLLKCAGLFRHTGRAGKKLEIESVFLKISQSAPVGNNEDQVDKYGPFYYMGYLNKRQEVTLRVSV